MPGAGGDGPAHGLAGLGAARRRVQETEVPVPGDVDEHFKLVFVGQVEKPAGGHVIDAEQVGPQGLDLGKVARGLFLGNEAGLVGRRLGSEGTVSQALDVKSLFAEPEELAVHAYAWPGKGRN